MVRLIYSIFFLNVLNLKKHKNSVARRAGIMLSMRFNELLMRPEVSGCQYRSGTLLFHGNLFKTVKISWSFLTLCYRLYIVSI